MSTTWHPRLLSTLLLSTFAPKLASTRREAAPEASIDMLLTFDEGGVSAHPNHVALYHGAKAFLAALMHRHQGWECPVKLYTLTSTSLLRKYLGLLDAPATVAAAVKGTKGKAMRSGKAGKGGKRERRLLFVSGMAEYWTARKAMTQGHRSQMVWFRWGWILLSRYMTVNDLKLEST
jgi:N-acetylglucosaminylphosphatidylinositol deacetylase